MNTEADDEAVLRMLAGASFGPDASVTLPTGRRIDGDEAQALTSFHAPASDPRVDDQGAHLCDHAPMTFPDQGCPNWPACLSPTPGIGLMRTGRPITDDEAVAFAFAARWREAMAMGRPAALLVEREGHAHWHSPSKATRRARVAAWLRGWTR